MATRNPVNSPVEVGSNIPLFCRVLGPSRVAVWDFFHQQYEDASWDGNIYPAIVLSMWTFFPLHVGEWFIHGASGFWSVLKNSACSFFSPWRTVFFNRFSFGNKNLCKRRMLNHKIPFEGSELCCSFSMVMWPLWMWSCPLFESLQWKGQWRHRCM